MINLPTKNSKVGIECILIEGGYRIQTSEGYVIEDISAATAKGIANQIAAAIRNARDIGFEQGRQFIKDAIG